MIKITCGRLRNKFSGTIEDLKTPIIIDTNLIGWQFISKIKNLISKEVFNRYALLYLDEVSQ